MKAIFAMLVLIAVTQVNAQTLKWSYNVAGPSGRVGNFSQSIGDGSGGSVWLLNFGSGYDECDGVPSTYRIVWLNNAGRLIAQSDFFSGDCSEARIVRCSRNEVAVHFLVYSGNTMTVNFLRRLTLSKGSVITRDFELSPYEIPAKQTTDLESKAADKFGFFTYQRNQANQTNAVIRRYSN